MSAFKIILFIYGILMLGGGVMGYVKAHSKPSLIMGIISGILIFIGVYLLGSNLKIGMMLVTAVSAMLTGVFLLRLLKTHSFMPAGMLLLLSAAVLIFCLSQWQNIKP